MLVMNKGIFVKQMSDVREVLEIILVPYLVNTCLLVAYHLSGTVVEVEWRI